MFTPMTIEVKPCGIGGEAAMISVSGNNGWHVCRFSLTAEQAQSLVNQLEAALQDMENEQCQS